MDTTSSVKIKSPHRQVFPGTVLQQLTVFTGKWKVSGKNFDASPNAPGIPVQGTILYEWMAGKFFLVFHWDRSFSSSKHTGMGIIGYDSEHEELCTTNYDNLGYLRRYRIIHENNNWKFSGEYERAVIEFADDKKSFTETWELSDDGWNWKPMCQLTATTAD